MLEAGQHAPGFGLPDMHGELFHLSEYKGEKNVILYFYPKDDTPGCTIEAVDFTALKDELSTLDTLVLGISRDDAASHAAFCEKYNIGINLLVDATGDVCEKYGVWQEKDTAAGKKKGIVRSTFIIDKVGELRHVLYGVKADGHARQVLDLIKEMV